MIISETHSSTEELMLIFMTKVNVCNDVAKLATLFLDLETFQALLAT